MTGFKMMGNDLLDSRSHKGGATTSWTSIPTRLPSCEGTTSLMRTRTR